METINTSRAKQVSIMIYDYDNLPLSMTYTTEGTPIDLTEYRFDFYLKKDGTTIKTYTIAAGATTSDFLQKTGDDDNILAMEAMWEDIRDNVIDTKVFQGYKLIQVVTDPDEIPYAHIIYNINARNY